MTTAGKKSMTCCIDGACTMPDAAWHGTPSGYNNRNCRCAACREAWRVYFLTGPGRRARDAYRRRLRDAGLVSTSSWSSPVKRQVPYQERPRKETRAEAQ